jgi:aminoglycoside phosphotransferase family enzyme/predicted kinase
MLTEDQSEVVEFLAAPATHGGLPVERIETHASVVFLAGARALKLKRAVRYDYLDFSTIARRQAMCEAELRLNRRMAPAIYRRVVAVTREPDGSLSLDGSGQPVDWLVEMVRFDQDDLFDRRAARGALDLDLMPGLASAIAHFHQGAERRPDHGGASGMAWVVDGNARGFAEQGAGFLDPAACGRLTDRSHDAIARDHALLDDRRAAGYVRQCHGDLHLRNIVLLEGRPTLFDGVEFNDEIACTDVLYDLAFLLMDLWRRQLPRHANAVWNRYLLDMGRAGIALLPLFLSCRAAVRAKTTASSARLQSESGRGLELQALAGEYLTMAQELLAPAPPCLVAVGGWSGSGKSTLARGLAPFVGAVPGAVVIRSDEIRKRICGVDPLQPLGPEGYTEEVSRRVYGEIAAGAAEVIANGHAAMADAVYARPADRRAIEEVAAASGVPFAGLWLEAPEPVLVARSERRRRDASDADAGVIRRQLTADAGALTWQRVDARPPAREIARTAALSMRERLGSTVVRLEPPITRQAGR